MISALSAIGSALGTVVYREAEPDRVKSALGALHPVSSVRPLIRIGGDGDGGYLVADDLDGIAACFSPGVAAMADFELAMADRGIPSFMADASVAGPPVSSPYFHFVPKFLAASPSADCITLEDWVSASAPAGDLLLQMDIEGAEWEVLLATPSAVLRRFRIMVIELHHLHRLFDGFSGRLLTAALNKVLADFHVVHAHPNNALPAETRNGVTIPRLLEITLLRKDRAVGPYRSDFPHPLDRDNTSAPPQPLPASLFRVP
jgi:hypothetical protein